MKTYSNIIDNVQHIVSIRRLPLRAGDNDTRYRVRLITATLAGDIISNAYRDMPMDKAYRVFDANVARLSR